MIDYRKRVSNGHAKQLLGFQPKQKLPAEGTNWTYLHADDGRRLNFILRLLPQFPGGNRRHKHRLQACCLICNRELSVGRVHQHVCSFKRSRA